MQVICIKEGKSMCDQCDGSELKPVFGNEYTVTEKINIAEYKNALFFGIKELSPDTWYAALLFAEVNGPRRGRYC